MATRTPLSQIDDPGVFMPGLLGIVHKDCSPWSSQEIESAYVGSSTKQHLLGSSLPILAKDSHSFFYPLTGVKSTIDDCNVCLQKLSGTDIIMRIPVSVREFKSLSKQRLNGFLKDCDCPLTILARSGCQNPRHK